MFLIYIAVASAPIYNFWEFLEQCTPQNVLSKPMAAFPHGHNVKRMDSGKRGMNPVEMTASSILQKNNCPSQRFEPATLCSQVFYSTDWNTGAQRKCEKQ